MCVRKIGMGIEGMGNHSRNVDIERPLRLVSSERGGASARMLTKLVGKTLSTDHGFRSTVVT